MALHSEDAGPDRLKYGVLEGRHQILFILDRVRVLADLVADGLPAQAHRRHDALGRELEGQILEDRRERCRRCSAGRRRGRPGGEGASKGGADGLAWPPFARRFERSADGLARPWCGWRVAAGIDERGHGFF